jgi:hypothetical protein
LSDGELLWRAAREVAVAVITVANAIRGHTTILLTEPSELGALMRAVAECSRAATVAARGSSPGPRPGRNGAMPSAPASKGCSRPTKPAPKWAASTQTPRPNQTELKESKPL